MQHTKHSPAGTSHSLAPRTGTFREHQPVPAVGDHRVEIYTDGACRGNPGPGGWAWAVAPDGEVRGSGAGDGRETNQRMEIRAVLEALRAIPDHRVQIATDSEYVAKCFSDGWYRRWEQNGWRNSKGAPVANADLWQPLVAIVKERDVRFRWVKAHAGDVMNELVDALAVSHT